MSAKLGEILVRENLISPQHLREALDYQREHGGRLGFNLVKLGLVSDDMITAVLSGSTAFLPSISISSISTPQSSVSSLRRSRKNILFCPSRASAQLSLWRWSIRPTSSPWTTSSS